MSADYQSGGHSVNLVDIVALTVDLKNIVLATASGTSTIAGFLCAIPSQDVVPIGSTYSWTGTVTTTPQKVLHILGIDTALGVGVALPALIGGLHGQLSADVIYAFDGLAGAYVVTTALGTDMTAHPTRYPVISATNDLHLGRA